MSAKISYTPGPWRDNSFTMDGKLELACAVWDAAGNVPICSTRFSVGKHEAASKETQHANARLIAAAPDLVAALQRAQAHIEKPESDIAGLLYEIRAALSKAWAA